MVETRITKKVDYIEFRQLIDKYKGRIKVNRHSYFRLSEMQRKVYKDRALMEMLIEGNPLFVGIQKNKNYAAFFRKKQVYIRLIFKITKEHLEIVTFYITQNIPKI